MFVKGAFRLTFSELLGFLIERDKSVSDTTFVNAVCAPAGRKPLKKLTHLQELRKLLPREFAHYGSLVVLPFHYPIIFKQQ